MLIDVNTLRGLVADLGVEAFETLMNLFKELARDLDASCKKKIPAKDLLPQVKQLIESLKLTIAEVGTLDVSSLA